MPTDLPLGRDVAYPRHYDPAQLFAIARRDGRAAIGLAADAVLPFIGHDRWQAWELGWLDLRGKPVVAMATLQVPHDSPNLVESKSLKLYLNSFNAERIASAGALRATLVADLTRCAGAPVDVSFDVPAIAALQGEDLDAQDIAIDCYGPPDRALLMRADARVADADSDDHGAGGGDAAPRAPGPASEVLHSNLLKSNCPVTGQPDWASITIAYRGARIDRAGLLRYLVSYRDHAGFHEQCVEQVFVDILARCQPDALCVEARYTRRGGLDINPLRATPGWLLPPPARDPRQ